MTKYLLQLANQILTTQSQNTTRHYKT